MILPSKLALTKLLPVYKSIIELIIVSCYYNSKNIFYFKTSHIIIFLSF